MVPDRWVYPEPQPRWCSHLLVTQLMSNINDRDHLVFLHLPSIKTSETCTDNLSEGLLPLQGSFKGLSRTPHPRLKSQIYTMEEGIDNPTFTNVDEVALKTIENNIKKVIPSSGVTEKEFKDPIGSEEYEEGPCGWGRFTPSFLQCCNNPKGYLVMYSLLAIMQGEQHSFLLFLLTQ